MFLSRYEPPLAVSYLAKKGLRNAFGNGQVPSQLFDLNLEVNQQNPKLCVFARQTRHLKLEYLVILVQLMVLKSEGRVLAAHLSVQKVFLALGLF